MPTLTSPSPVPASSAPTLSTISVVISAFTEARWPQLLEAVSSVAAQRVPTELVVVIDHNEALLQRAKRALPAHHEAHQATPASSLEIVANTQARGLSGARNSGVAASKGEIIAFLDDDAVAEPGWLEQLLSAYCDPQVQGVGGAVLPLWPSAAPRWFPEEFLWVLGCSYRGGPEQEGAVRNFIGCNMSFRRSALQAVGTFRTEVGRLGSYPAGCEETELCIRIQQRFPGGTLLHKPSARVLHQLDPKRLTLGYFLARCAAEGRSKAYVAGLAGSKDALSAERSYALKALPQGVMRALGDALFRGEPAGLARAGNIVWGLAATAAGYLKGRAEGRFMGERQEDKRQNAEAEPAAAFEPTQLLELDLSQPLPDLRPGVREGGGVYTRALALVRLGTEPLGMLPLELGSGVTREKLAAHLWEAFDKPLSARFGARKLGTEGLRGAPGVLEEPKEAPFISVIIATHDRTESLARCLASLSRLSYPDYEVIVVDNAPSSLDTSELVRNDPSGRLRYVCENTPGLAVAHNRGLREARGELVAFTDDDVQVDRFWLEKLVQGFAAAENVGCVTGMIVPAELETPAQDLLEQYGGFNKGFELRRFDMRANRPPDPLYPYTAGVFGSGANMAFTRSALLDFGGFDPALGAGSKGVGGDDLAAFFEVVTSGYTLVYQPAAIVHHAHRRDYAGLRRTAYGYGVGLTAFLTKVVLEHPARLLSILPLVPRALSHALSPSSPKNAKKRADYPAELGRLELKGMLYGPAAYLRSRWHLRKFRPVRPLTPPSAQSLPRLSATRLEE